MAAQARFTREERAALKAPLPEHYKTLSQAEIDVLWRTGSAVDRRRLGKEGLLPSWLRIAPNRAGYTLRNAAGRVVGRARSKEAAERARRTKARFEASIEREKKKRETHAIAKFGNLYWVSDHVDAGPYQLAWSRLQYVLAEFGGRTPSVGRPMTAAQKEAFHQSRAAFNAIREAFYSEQDFEAQIQNMGEARNLVKLATKFARGEWKKWAHTPSSAEDYATYERDVAKRLEGAVSVEGLAAKALNRADTSLNRAGPLSDTQLKALVFVARSTTAGFVGAELGAHVTAGSLTEKTADSLASRGMLTATPYYGFGGGRVYHLTGPGIGRLMGSALIDTPTAEKAEALLDLVPTLADRYPDRFGRTNRG